MKEQAQKIEHQVRFRKGDVELEIKAGGQAMGS